MEELFTQPGFFSAEVVNVMKKTILVQPNWKWLVIFTAFVMGFSLRPVLQFAIKKAKEHSVFITRYEKDFWSHFIRLEAERPAAWLMVIGLWYFAGEAAELRGGFAKNYAHLLNGLFAFQVIRLIYYAVDALGYVMMAKASKTTGTFDDQLASFTKKALKFVVVVMGMLIVLQSFGLNVMSLLAGLGLGGLALALAAQDTAANVFGSITILFDQPFKLGDAIKVSGIEGTVEEIGFRSTRVRTYYNSLVSIPNSVVAKEILDNMGVRPARRIQTNLGIAYDTPADKIPDFCQNIRYIILQHGPVRKEGVTVAFNRYDASSLNIFINFHIEVATYDEEVALQQTVYLEVLKLAETMGIEFAYPTQIVYYRNDERSQAKLTAQQPESNI